MLRIALFLGTNLAVMVVAGIVMSLLGLNTQTMGGLLAVCFIYGMLGSFISLLMSKKMAMWTTKTRLINEPTNQTEAWLVDTVKRQAAAAGIKMPDVGIFPSSEPNAFATGWNKNAALVSVSEGLLARMGKQEVEAVLGHEIGHVANGDMVTMALIQGVVNAFVLFFARLAAEFVDRVVFKNEEGPGVGFFITNMVFQILFGILASVIVMWFSRRREFRADEMGAKLSNKQAMISALLALKQGHSAEAEANVPKQMQAMAISGKDLKSLFSTHPSLDDRVAALQAKQI